MKQKIFFTQKLRDKLFGIVEKLKPKKILFVTANKSYLKSDIQSLVNPIIKNYSIKRFYGFDNNPKLSDVKKGIELLKDFKPDMIISIGGGSVIDMGKLINILSQNTNSSELIKNNIKLKKSKLKMVAIPTTSGTGSESTSFAVVYINNKKYSVSHKSMMPDYAFIDSNLSNSMSKRLRASSAFDAFSQSIESYWSINSTIKSKNISRKAITLIKNNIIASFKNSFDARAAMARAANLSGQAINITKTTAPHALSYKISSKYGLQHGHAVALTLGKFFIINAPKDDINILDKRGHKYLLKTMKSLFKILEVTSAQEASAYWYNLMQRTGLESNVIKACSLNKDGLKKIILSVDQFRLKNNPVKIDNTDLAQALWEK
jgi:alcohol dehydrogenase